MKLTGLLHRQLTDALLSAFPRKTNLAQMVRIGLDNNLDEIALGENLREIVFNLIEVSQTEGWTDQLINAAYESNPGNTKLKQFYQQYKLESIPKSEEMETLTNEYSNILIRILPQREKNSWIYPIHAILNDGSRYEDGQLHLDEQAQEDLLATIEDAKSYGIRLFHALFSGSIRTAYNTITGHAEALSAGRLRVRLWIDEEAAELHTISWERLYHEHKGQMVPLAASVLTPFSRYIGLKIAEPRPVSTSPIRLLVAISNPLHLPPGLSPIDVENEVDNLCRALGDLQDKNHIRVILMPGQSGVSLALRMQLEREGYQILDCVTSLDNILRFSAGCHVLHFLGHGFFQPQGEQGKATAALYLENEDKSGEIVKDDDLVTKLAAAEPLPHLVFLSACESAKQDGEAFVGLGPKLVKAGVPAVVAMQDRLPMDVARQLTADFYRNLLEHGMIDQALNQARLLLFNQNRPDWSIPVLFTRLEHGQLFTTFQKIERLKKDFSDKENKEVLSLSLDVAPSGIIPGKVPYNTAEIRKLLREGLSDQDLNDLCLDNFRIVYDQFSLGMTKQQKIHSLIEHCSRRNKFPQLLELVKGLSPEKYAEYEHSQTSAGQ